MNKGSRDNSKDICLEFAERDTRLSILSKRMEDFEQLEIRSKGEFIIFIDGDDFIEPNYLEELYHVSLKNNSEVVIGSYKQFNDEDTKYYIHIFDYREENYINKELIEKISLLERKGLEFQPTWEVYSIEGYLKM